jgi:NAD(P)H-flavin reductase
MSIPRKIRCTVESITDHSGRVYTVDLVPQSVVPGFKPGQFLHLTVDDYDPSGFWPESRVFSIASSPRDRSRIRICYSVKGRYTTRMEQMLKVGGEVWIKMPYGDFVIDETSDAVLIAGGTGISAFTAFLEALTPQGSQTVTLVYGARTPALLLFQEMILAQLAAVSKLNVVFFTETPDEAFARRMAALPRAPRCLTGRISLDAVFSLPSSVFFLSGPPVMLNVLSADLKSRGLPPEQIRTDAWE